MKTTPRTPTTPCIAWIAGSLLRRLSVVGMLLSLACSENTPSAPPTPVLEPAPAEPPPIPLEIPGINAPCPTTLVAAGNPDLVRVVRIAGDLLHEQHRPEVALALYERVLEAHRGGCELPPRDHWRVLNGAGIAALQTEEFERGVRHLEQTLTSGVPTSAYNLACNYCRLGNLDACAQNLRRTLEFARDNQLPAWGSNLNPGVSHYLELSAQDSDLAQLRQAGRYQDIVAPFVVP